MVTAALASSYTVSILTSLGAKTLCRIPRTGEGMVYIRNPNTSINCPNRWVSTEHYKWRHNENKSLKTKEKYSTGLS